MKSPQDLLDWKAQITKELTDAGFTVDEFHGWPIVKEPLTFDQRYKLIKFRTELSKVMTIYAEGALFTPFRIQ